MKKVKKYNSRNSLRRDMLELNPVYKDFVSGLKCGSGKFFFCRVCELDVGMKARGSGEFARHFRSDSHWCKDVTFCVHMGLSVLNRLMEPMVLSDTQMANFKSRAFVDLAEGYPFPEDLVPKHSTVTSRVPFMTLVSGFSDLLQSWSDYTLLRRLWGHFCSSVGAGHLTYSILWRSSHTVVSCLGFSVFSLLRPLCCFSFFSVGGCWPLLNCNFLLNLVVSVFPVSRLCSESVWSDVEEYSQLQRVCRSVRED